ncbi:MAG: hypothetical protein ACI4S3_01115, partial [Candidatus Gastranaerophilaceae bacterium]
GIFQRRYFEHTIIDEKDLEVLLPQRKTNQTDEYNSKPNDEMKKVFLTYLLHPNKFSIGKSISLTKHI